MNVNFAPLRPFTSVIQVDIHSDTVPCDQEFRYVSRKQCSTVHATVRNSTVHIVTVIISVQKVLDDASFILTNSGIKKIKN